MRQLGTVRTAGVIAATVLLTLPAVAGAAARPSAASPQVVSAKSARGRLLVEGRALGLVRLPGKPQPGAHLRSTPFAGFDGDGSPVLYWGGPVMGKSVSSVRTVTVHVLFWEPTGTPSSGAINTQFPGLEGLINTYWTDVAHDSAAGDTSNVFTVDSEYSGSNISGAVKVVYAGMATDTDQFPTAAAQTCPVPATSGVNDTCYDDLGIGTEVANYTAAHTLPIGLGNLYMVYVAPDANSCIDNAGTSCSVSEINQPSGVYCAYHSSILEGTAPASDFSNEAMYANMPLDTLRSTGCADKSTPSPNANEFADAELSFTSHESNEAITDPFGTAWFDDQGFEVGDKCAYNYGTPLGLHNSDSYNQSINGDFYYTQTEWSNNDVAGPGAGCIQSSTSPEAAVALPGIVNVDRYSGTLSGHTPTAGSGDMVDVSLLRGGAPVDTAHTTATGVAWGPVTLSGGHAIGDDRDAVQVCVGALPCDTFTGNGSATPGDLGDGAMPLTAVSGLVTLSSQPGPDTTVTLGSCSFLGPFTINVVGSNGDGHTLSIPVPSNASACDTSTTPPSISFELPFALTPTDTVTLSEMDAGLDNGDLDLTVPVGEVDAGGPAACDADLTAQTVTCTNLVPLASYTLTDGAEQVQGTADDSGTLPESLAIKGNDAVALRNASGVLLTTLHVAHLRVAIDDANPDYTAGVCAANEWFGTLAGTASPPAVPTLCPSSGSASGVLDDASEQQFDEFSGDVTSLDVPSVADMTPLSGQEVFGSFAAFADVETSDGSRSAAVTTLSLTPLSSNTAVFTSGNANTPGGTTVPALTQGRYRTTWTVTDSNGDVHSSHGTLAIASPLEGPQGPPGPQGAQGPTGPQGPQGPAGPKPKVTCKLLKHNKIQCTVKFPKSHIKAGLLRVSISRGGHLVALGHGRVVRGSATLTMHALQARARGAWNITVAFSQTVRKATSTQTLPVRVR